MSWHSFSQEIDGGALQFLADLFQQGDAQHVEPEYFHV